MLTAEERAILDFERSWWMQPGPKDQAIEFALGVTAAVYYQSLLELLSEPGAIEYDPLTVKRVTAMVDEPVGRELAV